MSDWLWNAQMKMAALTVTVLGSQTLFGLKSVT